MVQEILTDGRVAEFDPAPFLKDVSATSKSSGLYILVKENLDTLEALRLIAAKLRIKRTGVKFFGLKDKRAQTAQFVVLNPIKESRMELSLPHGSMKLALVGEDAASSVTPKLWGNLFRIRMTGIEMQASEVENTINETLHELNQAGGITNFYGHQRFGTRRQITHEVGRRIVAGDLPGAIETFLWYDRGSWTMPPAANFERHMMNYMHENRDDYSGTLRQVPVTLRQLFVHAFQSFLFNRFLSARIAEGMPLDRALEGDWTLGTDPGGYSLDEPLKATVTNLQALNHQIKSGEKRLALPVPGYSTELSGGHQGQLEMRIMSAEGVSLKAFYTGALPEASSPGKLRCATVPASRLEWKMSRQDNSYTATFEFRLPKESYATVFLREIMKPQNPIAAGF